MGGLKKTAVGRGRPVGRQQTRGRMTSAVAILIVGLVTPPAVATTLDIAGLQPESLVTDREQVPEILPRTDAQSYARIFKLQDSGEWRDADRLIDQLENRLLMGHVLFQRYMHPTRYRSKYMELKRWLESYRDHPGADRIYRLALRRRPEGYKAPPRPIVPRASFGFVEPQIEINSQARAKRYKVRKVASRPLVARIVQEIKKGRPSRASKILYSKEAWRRLDRVTFDTVRVKVAAAFFFAGKDKLALKLASESADRSRADVEMADWFAGMAAWRLGEIETAQRHFETLARSETGSPWTISAGAYWAARAYLIDRQPERVNPLLAIAANHPRTFYGLLAARLLSKHIDFRWQTPPLSGSDLASLMKAPATARAIALAQARRHELADLELRNVYLGGGSAAGPALLGLASRLGIPATQLKLADRLNGFDGQPYDAALFPVPPWEPEGGFAVDRALLYAIIRQESRFDVRAKSHAGARGLMQLMPGTASYVANDRSLRGRDKTKLLAPNFNMRLGQKYIAYLMAQEGIRGNLFMLTAAYNGGPGNLKKWLKSAKHQDDPLLFIESIPSRETRNFVERVLANFWIYRERLKQDTPSLDAVATGHWPYYLALDGNGLTVAQKHGED